MAENPKVIVITGISGSESKKICGGYADIHRAKVFSTGDLMEKAVQPAKNRVPFSPENLLNLNPIILDNLRDKIFAKIKEEIEKKEYPRYVIDTHAQFFWDHVFENAFDWKHLDMINADMYITIIDKPSSIKKRQMRTEQGRIQDHDLRDLLLWQNIEVNITKGWADKYVRPFYVLPSGHEPDMIDSLLYNKFQIYFQMPMTGITKEQNQKISEFKARLLEFGKTLNGGTLPIIDPRSIDMETGENLDQRVEIAIRRQTNHRDLNWYIGVDASDLVAYYPPGTGLSRGVSDETVRGLETGKNTFVIYPRARSMTSPFMDRARVVFEDENTFFDYFKEYLPRRLEQLKRSGQAR
ncbi:AAA family ATPase [Candidatus Woesearchaeota archaeon]|nr:AAA family ATPase [Candidatus Woesearchaeota archaeon]